MTRISNVGRRGIALLMVVALVAAGILGTVVVTKVASNHGPPTPEQVTALTGIGSVLESVLPGVGLITTALATLWGTAQNKRANTNEAASAALADKAGQGVLDQLPDHHYITVARAKARNTARKT